MPDAFMLIERYNWTLHDIEAMAWSDYLAISDGCKDMYSREQKAADQAAKGR